MRKIVHIQNATALGPTTFTVSKKDTVSKKEFTENQFKLDWRNAVDQVKKSRNFNQYLDQILNIMEDDGYRFNKEYNIIEVSF